MNGYYRAFPPCRILLVEDQEPQVDDLCLLLRAQLGDDAEVSTAKTIKEAESAIREAQSTGAALDMVIKDVLLPEDTGEHLTYDFETCKIIPSGTPIIHITGYGDDEEVQKHIRSCLPGPLDAKPMVIAKDGSTLWIKQLMKHVRAFVYGRAIVDLFQAHFGSRNQFHHLSSGSYPAGSTHQLAALMRLIKTHWSDLDGSVKTSIQEHFDVKIEGEKVVDIEMA